MKKIGLYITVTMLMVICLLMNEEVIQAEEIDVKQTIESTLKWAEKNDSISNFYEGDTSCDWMTLAAQRYKGIKGYEKYVNDLMKYAKQDDLKVTDYERAVIVVGAFGINGKELINRIESAENIDEQGINGVIYGLMAFDSRAYQENEEAVNTRETMIKYIVDNQHDDGGFCLAGEESDVDITAMVLQCLAPYNNESHKEVMETVDKAVRYLGEAQTQNGGYESYGVENSESSSQVILALCALKINPVEDERLLKNGMSVVDALLTYQKEDGGFAHIKDGQSDSMAGSQALSALVAYDRMVNEKSFIYVYDDVKEAKQILNNNVENKRIISITLICVGVVIFIFGMTVIYLGAKAWKREKAGETK